MQDIPSYSVRIDIREPLEVAEGIADHDYVDFFEIEELDTGDIVVENEVAFERKTLSDLASSLKDGRLKKQAKAMLESEYDPHILVEGHLGETLDHTKMRKSSLRGITASLTKRYGIPVLYCSTPQSLYDMAMRLSEKSLTEKSETFTPDIEYDEEDSQMVRFFLTVDGIGVERAQNLAERFPTPLSVIAAKKDTVMEVEGIGEKKAKAVKEAFDP